MASLVLSAVGSTLGATLFQGTAFAALAPQIGGALGTLAGGFIDNALFGTTTNTNVGRIHDLRMTTSREGFAVPRVYGRARIASSVIWATDFTEKKKTKKVGGGGKGGGGGATVTEFSYFANFAVGLCEGPIESLGRVWADGEPIEIGRYTTRLYKGVEDQLPDSLIESVEGEGRAPAYRGLAYLVFEELPLESFGNRVPQLNFEVFRPLSSASGTLEQTIQAVTLAPAGGEFALGTQVIDRDDGEGLGLLENMFNGRGLSNWIVAQALLESDLPQATSIALQVAWAGDDLRCGTMVLKPAVSSAIKSTDPYTWMVNGVARVDAHLLAEDSVGTVLEPTPADDAVVEAIVELKARGKRIMFTPLIRLDIPTGNGLDNPYAPGTDQPRNPWRGRITCDPAPGITGTVDNTAAASTQVTSFFGSAAATDFSVSGTSVTWSGGTDWGYCRMVLHYAKLCVAAGGVDAFLIGSQMGGISRIRSAAGVYPGVDELKTLAADVKAIVGANTKVSYAANWGEYHSHAPGDGSGDLDFHLDALWADANIDFVGIDNFMPLTDWRDGQAHLDALAGWSDGHELAYLASGIAGGEEFDWYYADSAARDSQTRTTITDATYAEPWALRIKDIKGWWENTHHPRPGGVRAATPTAWAAQAKPIWFCELGCPAVDKGANRPGLVFDVLSDESALPPYSTGARDDLIQRRLIEAHLAHWAAPANNPTSTQYTGAMVDVSNIYIAQWDPRPFPDFPRRSSVWRDTANWRTGRWVTGRVGGSGLAALVTSLCTEIGFTAVDASALTGSVPGYVIDNLSSPRDAIQNLAIAYQFDAVESQGIIRFFHRDQGVSGAFVDTALVEAGEGEATRYRLTRAQETELPLVAKMTFLEDGGDYQPATVEFRRTTVGTDRVAQIEMPLVLDSDEAQGIVDVWLMDHWVQREKLEANLPPSALRFDPGDVIDFALQGRTYTMRLTDIGDTFAREAKGAATDRDVYKKLTGVGIGGRMPGVPIYRRPTAAFLDLPLIAGEEAPHAPHFAVAVAPWPGGIALYRSESNTDFELDRVLNEPATFGVTLADFAPGPSARIDYANKLQVRIGIGAFVSVTIEQMLSGANLAALETPTGEWEVIQFRDAMLTDTLTYELSALLRGQFGTEHLMANPLPTGSRFVLLDQAVKQTALTLNERQLERTWRYGPTAVPLTHRTYKTETRSFAGVGLRPYAIVLLNAYKNSGINHIEIDWTRRSRVGGDEWETEEIPLGELEEKYLVEIMDGASVKRSWYAATPATQYSTSDQNTDWGSTISTVTVRVCQVSELWGIGPYVEATFNV